MADAGQFARAPGAGSLLSTARRRPRSLPGVREPVLRVPGVDRVPVKDKVRRAGAAVGIDVIEVVVKDVILPPELRSAHAEL
jgi:hypothetical protein